MAFYMLLLIPTAFVLTDSEIPWGRRGAILGLALALAAWHQTGVALIWRLSGRLQEVVFLGYLLVSWSIWILLTNFEATYVVVIIGLFLQGIVFLSVFLSMRRMVYLTVALEGLNIWREVYIEGTPFGGWVIFDIISPVLFIMVAFFINAVAQQSEERQRLIGDLQATRDDLATAERNAGILGERHRLAREIHDTLAQGFTSIVIHLETLQRLFPSELTEVQQHHLDQAQRTARESLSEARSFVWALRPESLDRASLSEVLQRLAHRWSGETSIAATAVADGSESPLHPEVEVTLLRAAQEALSNVRKHAQASQVTITLSYLDDVVLLDVQDDGIGFDQAEIEASDSFELSGGYGLIALRERVEQLGGTRIIESTPGQGTTLVVQIPLDGQHFDGQSQQDSTDISERPLQKVTHDVNTNTNHR